jgi:hypothetical protein
MRSGTPRSAGTSIPGFDHSYVLRAASGIGEFAPQYGPRRGLFADLTQQL